MTADQTRILEMFRALTPSEREALLPQLADAAEAGSDELGPEEIAAIDEGLAQMRRGETIGADELFDRLAKKFGFLRVRGSNTAREPKPKSMTSSPME